MSNSCEIEGQAHVGASARVEVSVEKDSITVGGGARLAEKIFQGQKVSIEQQKGCWGLVECGGLWFLFISSAWATIKRRLFYLPCRVRRFPRSCHCKICDTGVDLDHRWTCSPYALIVVHLKLSRALGPLQHLDNGGRTRSRPRHQSTRVPLQTSIFAGSHQDSTQSSWQLTNMVTAKVPKSIHFESHSAAVQRWSLDSQSVHTCKACKFDHMVTAWLPVGRQLHSCTEPCHPESLVSDALQLLPPQY